MVRDSTKDKKWQGQEVDGGFPFEMGKIFQIEILAEGKLLKVCFSTTNDKIIIVYNHRLP